MISVILKILMRNSKTKPNQNNAFLAGKIANYKKSGPSLFESYLSIQKSLRFI